MVSGIAGLFGVMSIHLLEKSSFPGFLVCLKVKFYHDPVCWVGVMGFMDLLESLGS